MVEDQAHSRPHFIIDTSDDDIAARLTELETDMARAPERYLPIVMSIGEVASWQALEQSDKTIGIDGDALARIKLCFTNRFDKYVWFDEATENEVAADKDYQTQLNILRNKTSRALRQGGVTIHQENPEALAARDKIRNLRFQHFLGRAILWKEQNASEAADSNNSAA